MDRPDYQGQFVSFSGIDCHPRPWQRSGPPVVIGGSGTAALRRAVTMGNGWYGFGLDLPQTQRCVTALREAAGQHERPGELGRLELSITPAGPLDLAVVERYTELGIDRLVLLPQPDADRTQRHAPVPADQILRNIDTVADRIIAKM
jgi:alkanesulfonate monooxygenase SsuD/methylene tetrahydromethanopterin reductase-like flavin-dependent oxidoreductase (luciferase family)